MDVELKAALDAIRSGVAAYDPRLTALQRQVDSIDRIAQGGGFGSPIETKSLYDVVSEDPGIQRLLKDKRGNATLLLDLKTTITSAAVGATVSGTLPIGRLPDITQEARQQLTVRDLLTATPTTFQIIDFVRVSQPMTIASPVPEASLKPENAVNFNTVSERVRTIATWIPASRQVLDDVGGLVAFLNNSLRYYVNAEEELQMLSGDNVGDNLHGLIPQATQFNLGLLNLSQGWSKIDVIGRAIQQITSSKELQPTFVVLHPNDWWDIRLTRDGFGRYILGDPQQAGVSTSDGFVLNPTQNIFGLACVPTTNISQGVFLIGSGSPVAAEIMDRMEMQIDISTEHSTFFTQNLIAIRAEKRLALITRRPGSFVTGTFSTSPIAH